MRKLLMFAFAILHLNSPVHGKEFHVSGVGAKSCAGFTSQYKDNAIEELISFTWAQGYMSGLNSAQYLRKEGLRNLAAWPQDQQLAQIRLYCQQSPSSPYYLSVFELYHALPIN